MEPGIAIRFELDSGGPAWLVADDATRESLKASAPPPQGPIMTVAELHEIRAVRAMFPGGPLSTSKDQAEPQRRRA